MTKPLLVGLTGGIGSGKTTVSHMFKVLGIPIYYADDRAKWIMVNDPELKLEICATFGEESYEPSGALNRAYLAQRVFNQPEELARLNGLVHPAVGRDFTNWVAENKEAPYLIKEAALIFEAGSYKTLDKVITVTAPKAERLNRVILRDSQRSKQQIEAIMDKQLSERERKKRSDFVVSNDGKELVIPQVVALDKQLRALAGQ